MTARTFGAIAGRLVANKKPGRRTEQPVRRNSYDVDDRRAQVFRPIGDGTKVGAMRWRDRYLQVAEEYDRQMKKPGARHPIGANALRVLKTLLWLPGLDFKSGRLEPAIATIQEMTGFARKTVVDALRRLKEHGFLNWVRRTEKTGNEDGPRVKQATNAYFFDLARLHKRALMRLQQLLRRCMPQPDSPQSDGQEGAKIASKRAYDPILEGVLARMGTAFEEPSASSESGRNHGEGD
ncbi:hypothetical protein M527_06940 [Sphingobium indicum IP26]|uniref:Replication protein A n=1 Tax=Sphingobium indicum F2 TaxID=1450518 RepID=A0A8E1C329_9SPHN|nr:MULTISPECIES: hypothetical protein [Sphingobium]EPR09858.1 hypothetical protein M527_06940 [Sphingobium indicum IP26]EQB04986.1 hypothetical protein L286_09455 [Sphingobium sp. HDIP04]KER36651.1 hypothetical protein AL00_09245 [Sphingobium indicum F2]